MKKISSIASKYADKENAKKAYIEGNKILRDLFKEQPELEETIKGIPKELIIDDLAKVISVSQSIIDCKNCKSIDGCKSIYFGHTPSFDYNGSELRYTTNKCSYFKTFSRNAKKDSGFLINHFDKEMQNISAADVDKTIAERNNFLSDIASHLKDSMGYYLEGMPRVGKTYMSFILANKFADQGQTVAFIDIYQAFKEIKQGFERQDGSKKDALYRAENLFIKGMSRTKKFTKFEENELFNLVSERIKDGKKTFFISNFSPSEITRWSFWNDAISEKFLIMLEDNFKHYKVKGKRW